MSRHGRCMGLFAALALSALTPAPAAANEPPRCDSRTSAVVPDRSRVLPVYCSDRDGPSMIEVTVTQPSHGRLERSPLPGGYRYIPNAGYVGADSFTFRASDGVSTSEPATHHLVVTPANLPPQCAPQRLRVVIGSSSHAPPPSVNAGCYDPNEGDAVRLSVESQATNGHASVRYSSLTYAPAEGYRGSDSFSVRASDGELTSAAATVPVEVVDLAPPSCETPSLRPVRTGTAKQVDLRCVDNAGPLYLTGFDVVEPPAHGTIQATYSGLSYQADGGYRGNDRAIIRAKNGAGRSENVVLSFAVSDGANEPPRCFGPPWPLVVRSGRSMSLGIGCHDPDGDPLTLEISGDPEHGAASYSPNSFPYNTTYTPDDGYAGEDSFSYRATDGRSTSGAATVSIRVRGPGENTAPTCEPFWQSIRQSQKTNVALRCYDEEDDPLTYAYTAPQHGTAGRLQTGFGPAFFEYTAPGGYVGGDRMTFTATDSQGTASAAGTALLDIRAQLPLRCAQPPPRGTRTNRTAWFGFACDADEDTPAYPSAIHDPPDHGTLIGGSGGSFTYTPHEDFRGTDTFTVRATRGEQTSDIVQQVTVSDTYNTKPACTQDYSASTRQAEVELQFSCWDNDGDPVTIEVVDQPGHGSLSSFRANGTVTYTPDADFIGVDRFKIRPLDGHEAGAVVEQTVSVRSVSSNQRPICSSYTTMVQKGGETRAQPYCNDADGDPLTFRITAIPRHGIVSWDGTYGAFRYGAEDGFEGHDSFTYVANDGQIDSLAVVITIQVGDAGFSPPCSDLAANVTAGEARRLQLPCNPGPWWMDPRGVHYEIVEQPRHGTLSAPDASGYVTYTPHAQYAGEDRFTYRVRVGENRGKIGTARLGVGVRITNAPKDPAPPAATTATTATTQTAIKPDATRSPALPGGDPIARLGGRTTEVRSLSLGTARAYVDPATQAQGLRAGKTGTVDVLALVCQTACTVTVDPALELPGARAAAVRRALELKRQKLALAIGRPGLVTVKLPNAALKRLKKVRAAKLRLKVTVTDARGKRVADTARFTLRAAR